MATLLRKPIFTRTMGNDIAEPVAGNGPAFGRGITVTSPAQRSLKILRSRGLTCAIVERWNPYAKIRQDLLGFGDILAIGVELGIALVQTTSGSNHDARKDKIRAEPRAQNWKDAGGVIVLHSWAKRGARGKRKTWTLREEIL